MVEWGEGFGLGRIGVVLVDGWEGNLMVEFCIAGISMDSS